MAPAALVSALFAVFAWLLRGVSPGGALAGFALTFALYAAGGWKMFAVLVLVFILTWLATRTAARRQAGRTAAQVVANIGWAALLVALPVRAGYRPVLQVAALAALAEAAADTCASEIGKRFGGRTVLVNTWRAVPPGTDGGVSLLGSGTALLAALLVALAASAAGLLPLSAAPLRVIVPATLATFVDSLLGATLEPRGWVNNDAVNLVGTGTAALIAGLACCWAA